MKRIRFTEEQIIAVLREHEAGVKTADLARKHGISEATIIMLPRLRPVWSKKRTLPAGGAKWPTKPKIPELKIS